MTMHSRAWNFPAKCPPTDPRKNPDPHHPEK